MHDELQDTGRAPTDGQVQPEPSATPRRTSSPSASRIEELASTIASYTERHPEFVAELDTLSMRIEDYERMLAADQPLIITTDNTVG